MSAIHREHPDATPEEIEVLERAALLRAPLVVHRGPKEGRTCWYCDHEFRIAKGKPHTKWYSLCAFCLANEM